MKILNYTNFIKESIGGYKYGCVMIELDISNWDKMTSIINPEDIYESVGDSTYGVQENPHITIFYGLHDGVTLDTVKSIFEKVGGDIDVIIDGIDTFENKDFDVVKLNVNPDGTLQKLFDELSKLPNSNEFPDYKPHITISYVKNGTGKKYIDPDYKYTFKNINKICYSMANGEKEYFSI